MRESAPAWDNIGHGVGRNPRTVDISIAEVHSRGFRRSDGDEPRVMHAERWIREGEACAGSTTSSGNTPYAGCNAMMFEEVLEGTDRLTA